MLLYNAKIYSNNFSEIYSALIINSGKIVELFKEDPLLNDFSEKYDCKGNIIIPAFHDCHVHLEFLARQFTQINLKENITKHKFVDILRKSVKKYESGKWIKGGGFGRDFLENKPDIDLIDSITPNNPIFFYSRDIHSFFVNSKALKMLSEEQKKEYSNYIEKKQDKYTGMLYEKGESLFEKYLTCTIEEIEESFSKIEKYFFKNGITSVHNMDDGIVLEFLKKNKTNIRIYNYFRDVNEIPDFNFYGAKLFADGSLGSLTASMFENYDNTETNGIRVLTRNELDEKIKFYNSENIPVAIHAIGDNVCSDIIELFSKSKCTLNRLEHAQTINKKDLKNLKGIICSMQPGHIDDDIDISFKYLKNRIGDMYRFRSILDNDGILLFGSDAPVVEADVFKGVYNACVRKDNKGVEWNGKEKITRIEALNGYCQNAKIIENRDCDIFKNSSTDLILLNDDIINCSEDRIKKIDVLAVIKDGIIREV